MKAIKSIFQNKKFLSISVFILFLFLIPKIACARYEPGTGMEDDYKNALEDPGVNLPQFGLNVVKEVVRAGPRLLLNYPTLEGEEQANNGVTSVFAGLIGNMYQSKPVSSGQYFAYFSRRLNLASPVYAQGQGWSFLEPVLPLWTAVRNVVYLFYVILFVALGFMIMFRNKIDNQTAISIQNALPKIIVSLILVTFSYAICGLFIDLIYLFNSIIQQIFLSPLTKIAGSPTYVWQDKFYPITYAGKYIGAKNLVELIITGIKMILQLVGAIKGDFSGIFNLIIAVVAVTSVIKVFFNLLGKYVTIIISTIFSPLIFLWGSMPGQQDHTSRFFRSFLSAIITFPALLLLLNFAAAVVVAGNNLALKEIAPFSVQWLDTGLAPSQAMTTLTGFMGLGILMAASKISETIDDALQVKGGGGPGLGSEAAGALRRLPIIGSFVG